MSEVVDSLREAGISVLNLSKGIGRIEQWSYHREEATLVGKFYDDPSGRRCDGSYGTMEGGPNGGIGEGDLVVSEGFTYVLGTQFKEKVHG